MLSNVLVSDFMIQSFFLLHRNFFSTVCNLLTSLIVHVLKFSFHTLKYVTNAFHIKGKGKVVPVLN